MLQRVRFEYLFTAAYVIAGSLWISLSDKMIADSHKLEEITQMQTLKGWIYVLVTGVIFFLILSGQLRKMREAEQKAKTSDQLKSAFLQNISHEIRTPLNGIVGFSGLLQRTDITEEERQEYIKLILGCSDQLLKIVNDVLDISMIETGNVKASSTAIDLNAVMDEIFIVTEPLMEDHIYFTVEKGLPDSRAIINVDEIKLRQILNNLLSNAIKFTHKGQIKFGYKHRHSNLEFFVKDTGIGIEPKLHKEIFDRFRQAEVELTRQYTGSGLGLSICKGNIELMNGRIWLESIPGEGSVFYFSIPYLPIDPKELGNAPDKQKQITLPPKLKILVAEDEDMNFQYLREILSGEDVVLLRAVNGAEAVEYCENTHGIHLVLMDIKMPILNGFEATRRIRQFAPDLPIIAQTAFAMREEKQNAMDAGCTAHISKPYYKEQLLEVIEKYALKPEQTF